MKISVRLNGVSPGEAKQKEKSKRNFENAIKEKEKISRLQQKPKLESGSV